MLHRQQCILPGNHLTGIQRKSQKEIGREQNMLDNMERLGLKLKHVQDNIN